MVVIFKSLAKGQSPLNVRCGFFVPLPFFEVLGVCTWPVQMNNHLEGQIMINHWALFQSSQNPYTLNLHEYKGRASKLASHSRKPWQTPQAAWSICQFQFPSTSSDIRVKFHGETNAPCSTPKISEKKRGGFNAQNTIAVKMGTIFGRDRWYSYPSLTLWVNNWILVTLTEVKRWGDRAYCDIWGTLQVWIWIRFMFVIWNVPSASQWAH